MSIGISGGVEISIFALVFIGFAVGVIGGFIGVGGGFLVTPALVILGFPGNLAVGTGIAYVVGASLIAVVRHRGLGNIDLKFAACMAIGTMAGVEAGVELINHAKHRGMADEAVLIGSLAVMLTVGTFTAIESVKSKVRMDAERRRTGTRPRDVVHSAISEKVQSIHIWPMIDFPRSGIRISLWAIVAVGLAAGALSGFMGVGGGFVKMPAMVYLLGVPSLIAVGTDLTEIIVSGAYGTLRHGMSGNVEFVPAFVMVGGALIGAQFGALATRSASGPGVRIVLSFAIVLGALGTAVKIADVFSGGDVPAINQIAAVAVFGTMLALVVAIFAIVILAGMRNRGKAIPEWTRALLVPRQRYTVDTYESPVVDALVASEELPRVG